MILCWRLIWHLLIFILQISFNRLQIKKLGTVLCLALLLLIWIVNFGLLLKKNSPITTFKTAEELPHLDNQLFASDKKEFTPEEAGLQLKKYQELEKSGINNFYLLLNLNQLSQVLDQRTEAKEYWLKALKIQPVKSANLN